MTTELVKVGKIGTSHVGKLTHHTDTGNFKLEIFGPSRDQDYVCIWSMSSDEAMQDLKKLLE